MYTKSHLVISVALGAALAVVVGATPADAAILVGYAAVVGTAIDFDHFVIARLRAGDWRHLRSALTDPRAAVYDQDELFAEGDVGPLSRLLSHVLIAGAVVAGWWLLRRPLLAGVSAVVLYGHVVSDLFVSVRGYEW